MTDAIEQAKLSLTEEHSYILPGVKVMLEGDSGTGKTHAISTLVEAGITPFIIFTEPGMSTLAKLNIPKEKLHWAYVSMSTQDWSAMEAMGRNINKMTYEGLSKIQDANKGKYDQFLQVYKLCHDFVCERTGEHFGDVSTWGTDRCVVFDSLSGLATMSMNLTTGAKPTKAMPDWMVAMDNLERFITKICTDIKAHVVLTAHLSMEKDEVLGGISLMASSLGNKLSPKLPRYFDEVVHTIKDGDSFRWSTASRNVITKNRYLGLSDQLPASFVPMIETWKASGGVITSGQEEQTSAQ